MFKHIESQVSSEGENSDEKKKKALLKELQSDAARNHLVHRLRTRGLSAHDAEDVVQDIWLKIIRYVESDKFDYTKKWKALAETTITRELIDRKRKIRRHGGEHSDIEAHAFHLSSSGETAEESAESRELKRKLRQAVSRLPEKLREVMELSMEDKNVKEIAKELKVPYGTALSRLDRARKRLKTEGELEELRAA